MKILVQTLLIILYLSIISGHSADFDRIILQKCQLTEYEKYINCVENLVHQNKTDAIRTSLLTTDELSEPDCEKCNCEACKTEEFGAFSENNCCRKCCTFRPCDTRHCCFKTCHSGCDSLECRYFCRQSCFKFIEAQKRKKYSEINKSKFYNTDKLNITTRIKLNNVIDNVDNLSSPIHIKSSNLNDISIKDNQYEFVESVKCMKSSKFPFLECPSKKIGNSSVEKKFEKPCNSIHLIDNQTTLIQNRSDNATKATPIQILFYNPWQYYPLPVDFIKNNEIQNSGYQMLPNYYTPISPQYFPNSLQFSNPYYQNPPIYPPLFHPLAYPQTLPYQNLPITQPRINYQIPFYAPQISVPFVPPKYFETFLLNPNIALSFNRFNWPNDAEIIIDEKNGTIRKQS